MNKLFIGFIFAMMVLALPVMVTAQEEDPDDGSWNDEAPDEVPVDGGLTLLVATGIGYGIKKANDMRQKRKSGEKETE